jgi:Tfp pilus assembly protein PilX
MDSLCQFEEYTLKNKSGYILVICMLLLMLVASLILSFEKALLLESKITRNYVEIINSL